MSETKNIEFEESQKRILEFSNKINKVDHQNRKKIFLSLKHASKSEMTSSISVFFPIAEDMVKVDWDVASIVDSKIDDKHGGVKITGCNMDMGLALLDDLFFKIGEFGWQKKYKMEWVNGY